STRCPTDPTPMCRARPRLLRAAPPAPQTVRVSLIPFPTSFVVSSPLSVTAWEYATFPGIRTHPVVLFSYPKGRNGASTVSPAGAHRPEREECLSKAIHQATTKEPPSDIQLHNQRPSRP